MNPFKLFIGEESDKNICAKVVKHNLMKRIVYDPNKVIYCQSIGQKMFAFKTKFLNNNLPNMMDTLDKLIGVKKALFCHTCNQGESKLFNLNDNTVTFSKQFCFDMITEFKDYIQWKNLDMMKYLETYYQYLQCYNPESKAPSYPYKLPIPVYNRQKLAECLRVENIADINKCLEFCGEYNIFNFSSFFEGSLDKLNQLKSEILKVLRTQKFQMKNAPVKATQVGLPFSSNMHPSKMIRYIKEEAKLMKDLESNYPSKAIKRSIAS